MDNDEDHFRSSTSSSTSYDDEEKDIAHEAWNAYQVSLHSQSELNDLISSSSHVGSGIVPVDGVGRISYGRCLYHASPLCSITCILFYQSIFIHLILYLLFPRFFWSSSSSTTAHFNFQSLHYHIFIFFPQNMTVAPYITCFSDPI